MLETLSREVVVFEGLEVTAMETVSRGRSAGDGGGNSIESERCWSESRTGRSGGDLVEGEGEDFPDRGRGVLLVDAGVQTVSRVRGFGFEGPEVEAVETASSAGVAAFERER